jgi:hypothetical protein
MGGLYRVLETIAQGAYPCYPDKLQGSFVDVVDIQTFQSYMQFKEIPRKLIVAKRLAQCLNPALPTGVHQRALDVYSHILSVQGVSGQG